jgi:hypothetical protein
MQPTTDRGGQINHRPLGKVEDARGLVDQHEAERDEGIHHPREQAADQHFEKEIHFPVS